MPKGKRYEILKEFQEKYNISISNKKFDSMASKELRLKMNLKSLFQLCKKYKYVI